MDIYCPVKNCGEPWDNDSFHELVSEGEFKTYDKAVAAFRTKGCAIFGTSHNVSEANGLRSMASAALMDMLGDDTDGVMSMLDDFEFMGMLD